MVSHHWSGEETGRICSRVVLTLMDGMATNGVVDKRRKQPNDVPILEDALDVMRDNSGRNDGSENTRGRVKVGACDDSGR